MTTHRATTYYKLLSFSTTPLLLLSFQITPPHMPFWNWLVCHLSVNHLALKLFFTSISFAKWLNLWGCVYKVGFLTPQVRLHTSLLTLGNILLLYTIGWEFVFSEYEVSLFLKKKLLLSSFRRCEIHNSFTYETLTSCTFLPRKLLTYPRRLQNILVTLVVKKCIILFLKQSSCFLKATTFPVKVPLILKFK